MASMRKRLDRFLHHPHTDLVLIGLILLSVVLLIVEVASDRDGKAYGPVHVMGQLLTGLFVFELSARFWVAPRKSRFFRHYWFDLLSVIPFLPAFRVLRVLRLLRLHRVGLLFYRRLEGISGTLAAGVGVQMGVVLVVGMVVLVGGSAVHVLEGGENADFDSLGKSIWWSFFSLVSMQPTGGMPASEMGRFVTAFVVLGGMTTVAVLTGVVSAVMMQRLKLGMEVRDMDLDELRDHVVICGWNRAAHLIIAELQADPAYARRAIVVVAEFSEPPEQELKTLDRARIYFHSADYTSLDVLQDVGIPYASQAILLADKCRPRSDQDRDARTVLAALTMEKLNPKIFTCAQILDRKNNTQLQVAGVEHVVIDDEVSGQLIATTIRNRGLTNIITELLAVQMGNNLLKLALPPGWEGLTFEESARRLKEGHEAILVAIERHASGGRETLLNPPSGTTLRNTDALVIIARSLPQIS